VTNQAGSHTIELILHIPGPADRAER
jgi:hypothetical protein